MIVSVAIDFCQSFYIKINVLKCILMQFLGAFSRIEKSKVFTLKLFRILCTYGERSIDLLRGAGLKNVLKTAIFVQENNITVKSFIEFS